MEDQELQLILALVASDPEKAIETIKEKTKDQSVILKII